ncbi:MAG: hypothetical protein GY754_43315 [bacterium]|nr:hypothetical protein [bacterium]
MKKILYLLAILSFAALFAVQGFAKPKQISFSPAFKDGDMLIHAGVGFGLHGTVDNQSDISIPPLIGAFDMAVAISNLQLPFSFGGCVGYARYTYTNTADDTELTYSYVLIGGRILFHFNLLSKADIYAGLLIGANLVSFNASGTNSSTYSNVKAKDYFMHGEFVGIRYFFTKNFGVYGEMGYTFGYINGGIAIKF